MVEEQHIVVVVKENHRIEEEEGGRNIHHSDEEEEDNDETLAEEAVEAYSSSFHTIEVFVEEEATRSTPLRSDDDDGTETGGYCSTQQYRCSSSCSSRSLDNH